MKYASDCNKEMYGNGIPMKSSEIFSYKTRLWFPLISLKEVINKSTDRICYLAWKWKFSLCLHYLCWIFWYLKEHISKWCIKSYYINIRKKNEINLQDSPAYIHFYFIERAKNWFIHINNINKRCWERGHIFFIMWWPSVFINKQSH